MPLLLTTTLTKPGTAAGTVNLGTRPSIRKGPILPTQVMGFVPLHECGISDCRVRYSDCCDRNIVFGNVVNGVAAINSSYENDWNVFMVDYALFQNNPSAHAFWKLQRCEKTADTVAECNEHWNTLTDLNTNFYGVYEPLNSIPLHKTYTAYWINWGRVLKVYGQGFYRIKLETNYREQTTCSVSDEFWLRQFNCNIAHGTVKFEAWNTGQKGSATQQGKVFNLCGFNAYDSIRLPAFFGFLKPSEYLEVYNQNRNGKLSQVKNKLIRKYLFKSKLWPTEYHKRLSAYMVMADERKVSDYNKNNSDYTIKQVAIAKLGLYELEFFDKNYQPKQTASCEFREGVETIISSLCCSTVGVGIPR